MTTLHTLGAHLSPPDPRDHPVSRYAPAVSVPRPGQLDLRPTCVAVRNQGRLGACVAFSLVVAVMGSKERMTATNRDLSPLYSYLAARAADHADPAGEGTYPRSVLEQLRLVGAALESDMPYSDTVKPPVGPQAGAHAAMNKVPAYARVGDLITDKLEAMFLHGPIEATIDVQPGFDAGDGIIKPGGASRGLHAVTLVGYDEAQRFYWVQNSWGATWGDGGFGRLSFDYPIEESWAIIDAAIVADGQPQHPSAFPWLVYALNALNIHIPGWF